MVMEYAVGVRKSNRLEIADLKEGAYENQRISLHGAVHAIRDMGGMTFLTLRKRDGIVQCVCGKELDLSQVPEESAVVVTGTVRREGRAPGGFEVAADQLQVLSRPAAATPVPVSKFKLNLNLDTELALRPLVLRNLRQRSVFRIQEGLVRAFRDYLHSQGFTEIHTPKIVHAGAEGGSNIFRLDYFGRKAFLAQSPQFYKQTMVGIYERVFEVAPVFRAEKHSTARHLNEYTSMDFEMGYLDSFYEVMEMETGFLQYAMELLRREYSQDLERLGVELPQVERIPCVRFDEAKRLAAERYGHPIRDPYDLEPEEEINIGRYAKEEWGSDFVFVTHYPSKKRPFYAMDDPADPKFTLSFDLLFRGMEVTTGGQRVHDYQAQVDKMLRRGMHPEEFESYLMAHKYGLPPHGGLGLGLERLTMKLCGLENVRYAALFPRDLSRLEP
jgi:nondiscriminating aspartyl-tRNA synthetase